jgi:hypothetical protein
MSLTFTAAGEVDPGALPDTVYPETPLGLVITSEIKSTLASDRIIYRARCTVRTLADHIAWESLARTFLSDQRVTFSAFTTDGDVRILVWGVDAP